MILTLRRRKIQHGFSLVELLLTLVLILCLAAASVFSYTALHRTASLDEGLDRLESLIRFAQAEAATTGCKVRLQFEPAGTIDGDSGEGELRRILVTWEPDFLNSPGVFQEYTNKAWSEDIVNEVVGVAKVRPVGAPVPQLSTAAPGSPTDSLALMDTAEEEEAEDELATEFPGITFYPDGSCDSAELILASRNPEDARRLEVRLSGILGSVSSRVVSASSEEGMDEFGKDEFDPYSDEVAAEEYSPVDAPYTSESGFSSDAATGMLQ